MCTPEPYICLMNGSKSPYGNSLWLLYGYVELNLSCGFQIGHLTAGSDLRVLLVSASSLVKAAVNVQKVGVLYIYLNGAYELL